MPKNRHISLPTILAVQAVCLVLVAASVAGLLVRGRAALPAMRAPAEQIVHVEQQQAHRIEPLYDDPEVVSDDELAAVLAKVLPRFGRDDMQPNYLEHALRTWGVEATFAEDGVLSGAEMRDFLLDHRRQVDVFGHDSPPLLIDRPAGVGVRWEQPYDPRASAHHDHLLASLTEAGVPLDQPVFTLGSRRRSFADILQEAVRDFRLDEIETEWSAMAFALWFAPETTRFPSGDGRTLTFDLLARRLMRSQKNLGVCHGTHRIYTLVVLWRLDQESGGSVLSDEVREEVWRHLERIRDLIAASQFEDGHWPSNWADGQRAVANPIRDDEHQQVIATGHHLEWLAIAPRELHPDREQILRAADWAIATTTAKSDEEIRRQYTFYSHIGNALALWRGTTPAEFWRDRDQPPPEPARTPRRASDDPLPPAPSPLPPSPMP